VNRVRGPKTAWELALQLFVIVVPCALVGAASIRELSRGRPGSLIAGVVGLAVAIAGGVVFCGWAIREYVWWSSGVCPATTGDPSAASRHAVPIPSELLRSPRVLPEWARPRPWRLAAVGAVALAVNACFALVNDGGYMLRAALACTAAVIAYILPLVLLRRARRHLLARGTPAVATVSDVTLLKGTLSISYDFDTLGGRRTGTTTVDASAVERRFGGWPEIGDPAIVVHDAGALVKSTLWSLPVGRPRPDAGMSASQVGLWALLVVAFVVLYRVFSGR
jgi:hypothetical protein